MEQNPNSESPIDPFEHDDSTFWKRLVSSLVRHWKKIWAGTRSDSLEQESNQRDSVQKLSGETIYSPSARARLQSTAMVRLAVFLTMASLLIFILGIEFGGRFGLVIGFAINLFLAVKIFYLTPQSFIESFNPVYLEGRDPWGLVKEVKAVARMLRCAEPRVAISDSEDRFAFSVGILPSHSTIVISHSLLEELSTDEMRQIVSFEMARSCAQLTSVITITFGITSLLLPRRLKPKLKTSSARVASHFLSFGLLTAARVLAKALIRFTVGKSEVFKLDDWLASNIDSRENWARSLWNLDSMVGKHPRATNLADFAFDCVSPLSAFHGPSRESVIPTVQQRIETLIGRYPP